MRKPRKIKRYNKIYRSGYGTRKKVLRWSIFVVIILAVVFVGYSVAGPFMDFVNGRIEPSSSDSSSVDSSQTDSSSSSGLSSESEPEVGIYLNEQHGSKMGWYITREGTVTKTSCNGDGSRTYHVTYTLANTITDEELQTATDYILGPTQNSVGSSYVMQGGTSVQRMLFYAPAGGTITDFTSTGNVQDQVNKTMDGKELITNVAYLEPGTSVTYEFNVTTSPKATSDLKIDQSPAGWLESGITYDVDECPAE